MRFFFLVIVFFVAAISPLCADAANVSVHTSSSVNTGGAVAGAGETVTDSGSSASASVHTTISSSNSGGTADVVITTTQNGVTQTERRHIDVPAGESVSISVATTSSNTVSGQGVNATASHQTAPSVAVPVSAETALNDAIEVASTSVHASLDVALGTSTKPFAQGWFASAYQRVHSLFAHILSVFTF